MSNTKYINVNFNVLKGKIISRIDMTRGLEYEGDSIYFYCTDGTVYYMYHDRDCCETVKVEDIAGDLQKLIGYTIMIAEEATNNCPVPDRPYPDNLWTFYKLAAGKEYVTVRWLGKSEGFYAIDVDFVQVISE